MEEKSTKEVKTKTAKTTTTKTATAKKTTAAKTTSAKKATSSTATKKPVAKKTAVKEENVVETEKVAEKKTPAKKPVATKKVASKPAVKKTTVKKEETSIVEEVKVEAVEIKAEEPQVVKAEVEVPATKKVSVKKIFKTILKTLEISYVAIMLVFSLLIIASGNKNGAEVNSLPITHQTLLTVKTDSMKPTFDKDALVVARVPQKDKEILSLKEGDIISFKTIINGQEAINTHRIIKIANPDNIDDIRFVTKGDNVEEADLSLVAAHQVLAIYQTSIPHVGGWIAGLKDNYTFIYVVIVPLALLFIYNTFIFVRNLSEIKAEKLIAEGATLSEEEKERLKQEYLKSLENNKK